MGDKSLTHRALILGAIARGRSRLIHPNPGADCVATARALRELGARIDHAATGWDLSGSTGSLRTPAAPLRMGNSGTGMRLLSGLLACHPVRAVLTGDASLNRRPMRRIARPLREMGAEIVLRDEEFPPIEIRGGRLRAIRHTPEAPSAQVKGSLLLAGLGLSEGELIIEERIETRDHTERLLQWLGLPVDREAGRVVLRAPVPRHEGFEWIVPSDPSAATFYIVAAALVEGSDVRLDGVLLNPGRTGAVEILKRMGADVEIVPDEASGPEPTGTVRARASRLRGVSIAGPLLPRMIDEVPALAVAAAMADGETVIRDCAELRVKESDRIASTAAMLRALGCGVEAGPDWLRIEGAGRLKGGAVDPCGDHRIAMAGIVAGLAAEAPVVIEDVRPIASSDPTFIDRIVQLGASVS